MVWFLRRRDSRPTQVYGKVGHLPSFQLLDFPHDPDARRRRSRVFFAAFCMLALSVALRASDWDHGKADSGIFIWALGLSFLCGSLAIALRHGPASSSRPSRNGLGGTVSGRHVERSSSLDGFSSWRASRSNQLPALKLDDISSALTDHLKGGASTTRVPNQSRDLAEPTTEQTRDPWSRILSEFTAHSPKGHSKRRNSN